MDNSIRSNKTTTNQVPQADMNNKNFEDEKDQDLVDGAFEALLKRDYPMAFNSKSRVAD